jgi:DNA-binding NtrC family response regulator
MVKDQNTILLVDDNVEMLKVIQFNLRGEQYKTLTTDSAMKAVTIIEETDIKVIVADDKMPCMCGTKLLETVKRNNPDIVRILMTGNADADVASRALNDADIYRFVMKPINMFDLVVTIRRSIELYDLLCNSRELVYNSIGQSSIMKVLGRKLVDMNKKNPNYIVPSITRNDVKFRSAQEAKIKENVESLLDLMGEEIESLEKIMKCWV